MLVDLFITTKDRPKLLDRSLTSFFKNTDTRNVRLTVVQDGDNVGVTEVIAKHSTNIDHVLWHNENLGLGPSINQALAHIDSINRYHNNINFKTGHEKVSEFICYCQDDLIYSEAWLKKLLWCYFKNNQDGKLGFASGVECVEHEIESELPAFGEHKVVTKKWIRAANMLGRTYYWMSMWPIPKLDPETGRERAKPNDGIGSGVDWHFIRNHKNSVCKTGKTNLVIPGLIKHAGYDQSTWLNRELPESESDKKFIDGYYQNETE